jgi:hypothetical protein
MAASLLAICNRAAAKDREGGVVPMKLEFKNSIIREVK